MNELRANFGMFSFLRHFRALALLQIKYDDHSPAAALEQKKYAESLHKFILINFNKFNAKAKAG